MRAPSSVELSRVLRYHMVGGTRVLTAIPTQSASLSPGPGGMMLTLLFDQNTARINGSALRRATSERQTGLSTSSIGFLFP